MLGRGREGGGVWLILKAEQIRVYMLAAFRSQARFCPLNARTTPTLPAHACVHLATRAALAAACRAWHEPGGDNLSVPAERQADAYPPGVANLYAVTAMCDLRL